MSSDQVLAREPAAGFPLDDAAVQLSLDSARAADHAGLHTAVLDIMAVLRRTGYAARYCTRPGRRAS